MRVLAFAVGVLALACAASSAARADFAVIKFKETGACRTWYGAADKPWGNYQVLWAKTASADAARAKGAWAIKHHWCKSWS
jgi:hypothetical protein